MNVKRLILLKNFSPFRSSCHFSTSVPVPVIRRPGPSSSLRRKLPPSRIVFRDELEAEGAKARKQEGEGENTLLSPVNIPEDPRGVIQPSHPASDILRRSGLVVQRQLELGNLLLGFEQANKYVIMDPNGDHVGFMAEEESGIGKMLARQWFRTHRAFTAHVFDKNEKEVLRFYRPFSWINSRIFVYDPVSTAQSTAQSTHVLPARGRLIGECQQEWHLLRRKYNLFLYHGPITSSFESRAGEQHGGEGSGVFTQFAYVDEPFLSWDFSLLTAADQLIGSVNRNFAGFGREIFTDTGVYALRMDSAAAFSPTDGKIQASAATGRGMTLDERAVMLATAVTIDFDYFSRHSSHGGGGFFPFIWSGEHNAGGYSGSEGGRTGAPEPTRGGGENGSESGNGGGSRNGSENGEDYWPWDSS